MDRRGFIATLGLAGGVFTSLTANAKTIDGGLATPTRYRMIERWQNGLWESVLMRDLREGDVFRMNDVRGEFTAKSDAYKPTEGGYWAVEAFEHGSVD